MAEEFKENGIAVNGIWPSTVIFTNAIEKIYGQSLKQKCRKPEIMADAILEIACRDSKEFTGNLVTDEDVLTSRPLDEYNYENGDKLLPCLYIENTESMVHSDGRDAVFHRISGIITFNKLSFKKLMPKYPKLIKISALS
ncbi:Hydroxysteroid dehydrogenase-like protein 2 [Thelohanellus kitauei]|uniref:Hydroxysteroid dehydrogenase-like protein 2 n=1 Tax=Thelohanellus kitauei TaxID=669202 RepID=A0A0C2I598_THEKT|nr:Hydroxysteroid dehydrogenase-like protein 2 [Thelohanellus kitauei]